MTEAAISTPGVVAGSSAPGGRLREPVSRVLFPVSTVRVTWLEGAAVVLICWVIAYLRVGWSAGLRGTVWAEDGSVFLTQALTRGWRHSFVTEYAGYLHFAPRVIAAAVITLPLAWQGIAMGLAAALVQGLIALVAYVASRPYVRWRAARAVLALMVVAVPVGPEASDSVANLQWWLLFGAGVALLWTPLTRPGWICVAALLFLTCGSTPLAALPFALAVVRAVVQRRRATLFVAAAAAVAFAVQTGIMLSAPRRTGAQAIHTEVHPRLIAGGYVRRIFGDGVLGWRLGTRWNALGITAGLLVAAAVLAGIAFLIRRGRIRELVPVGGLIVMSMAVYSAEAVLSGTSGARSVGTSDRYFVAPALFFCAALVALLSWTVVEVMSGVTVATVTAGAVAATLVSCQVFGVVTSWHTGGEGRRDRGPAWSAGVHHAERACRGRPDTHPVNIPVSPAPWRAPLSCGVLRRR